MKRIVIGLLMGVLAGCSHAQAVAQTKPQSAVPPPAAPPKVPATAVQAPPVAEATPAAATPTLPESIHFLYDSATISSADAEPLSQLGLLLAKQPATKLRIEGNCDERGSEQYNLALGQRRAEAAKRYLERMGASSTHNATATYASAADAAAGAASRRSKKPRSGSSGSGGGGGAASAAASRHTSSRGGDGKRGKVLD